MRDILPDLNRWCEENNPIALATVIQTWGSSPRRVGSKMALTTDGKITGSVSGGCVENAVFEAGIESLKANCPRLLHFSVADETAWDVGLACGGSVDIFVQPLDPHFFHGLRSVLFKNSKAVLITVIRGPEELLGRAILMDEDENITGSIGKGWDEEILELARENLSNGTSHLYLLNESVEIFMEVILPPPTLIAVGGVHIAIALMSLAKTLGFRSIVVDPRKAWGNAMRFPQVDQLIQAWPEEAFQQIPVTTSTAIVMLTHDPKLDDAALQIALSGPAFYVGALGSRSTQTKRRRRLLEAGLTEVQMDKLHGPIGLDIGAETPEEIALAIMAEVVDARRRHLKRDPSLIP